MEGQNQHVIYIYVILRHTFLIQNIWSWSKHLIKFLHIKLLLGVKHSRLLD